MYEALITRIKQKMPLNLIAASLREERCFVIMRVHQIANILYSDREQARVDFDSRLIGTLLVNSKTDDLFTALANQARLNSISGIVYPSARHSRGVCIALLGDHSAHLRNDFFEVLNVTLQLISEKQNPDDLPRLCDPFTEIVDGTRGYYSFRDPERLRRLSITGVLNPQGLAHQGTIDLVRRRYVRYPQDAVAVPFTGKDERESRRLNNVTCPLKLSECSYNQAD